MKNNPIILFLHNVRSCYNVGSILRTADGLGIKTVYFDGYTPYPKLKDDKRLPHVYNRVDKQINKTSLGSHDYLNLKLSNDTEKTIKSLKKDGYKIISLEQDDRSVSLYDLKMAPKTVLIVGNETDGLGKNVLDLSDTILEIPMLGKKESFNVSVASALALHYLIRK